MKDHLGSVRAVLQSKEGVVGSYDYDAYGNLVNSPLGPKDSDFLYTGHFYHRPSGLYLAPFRAYDPRRGRWLSREPLGLDGPNLYHYVFNDPTNSYDLSGLQAIPDDGSVITFWPAPYPNLSPMAYPRTPPSPSPSIIPCNRFGYMSIHGFFLVDFGGDIGWKEVGWRGYDDFGRPEGIKTLDPPRFYWPKFFWDPKDYDIDRLYYDVIMSEGRMPGEFNVFVNNCYSWRNEMLEDHRID